MNVSAGLEIPGADFTPIFESYLKSTAAVNILFYSSLWSIKISFLILFRRLGTNVRHQKLLWWPVFAFTIATYFACIGATQYSCLVRSFEYISTKCIEPSAISYEQVFFKLNCGLDVLTDFLSRFIELPRDVVNISTVMLIPSTMLWGVQIQWRRKFTLAGIFSLVVITMIFAIVRTAVVTSSDKSHSPDSSWLYMWSAIEVSVGQWIMHTCFIDVISNVSLAIIVACLASLRNLFSRENPQHHPKFYEPPAASNLFLRGSKPRSRMRHFIDTLASTSENNHPSYQVQVHSGNGTESMTDHRHESHDQIPLNKAVHVRKDVVLVHEPAPL